jgi:hypothetical protein
MALSGISSIANTGHGLQVLNAPATVSTTSTKAITAIAPAPAVSPAPAPATSAPAPAAKATVSRGGGGGASSSSTQQLVSDTYTATVGGKSYSGSVQQEPGGGYIASIPSLPGAVATGSSVLAAVSNLGSIIDTLA